MSKIPGLSGKGGKIEQVWRAAIDCMMTNDNGYSGDSHHGYRGAQGNWPPVSGSTGDITLTPPTDVNMPNPPETTVNPWNDYYHPWIEKITDAFQGWDDDLPDPQKFGQHADHIHDAVTELTVAGNSQQGGSLIGNPYLVGPVSSISKDLDPHLDDDASGTAISTFNQYYGPDVIETVTGNVRQSIIVLYLAQLGEQQVWKRARADIVSLADKAVTAFKKARKENAEKAFTACSALVDVAAAFQPEAAPVAAAIKFAGAVNNLSNPNEKPQSPKLDGSTAEEIYTNLADSIGTLNQVIWHREEDIHNMLADAFRTMNDDPDFFVFYRKRGVRPEIRGQQIKVDTGLMKMIGYKLMPDIAAVLARAARPLAASNSVLDWLRPANIGYGSSGPWDEYFYLDELVRETLLSDGNQLVTAGEVLAEAAGYLHDTDHLTEHALKGEQGLLKHGGTGWPSVDDSPDDTYGWSRRRPPL